MGAGGRAEAQQQRRNLLIIRGDDIGQDDGSPVDFSYTPAFEFTGKIEKEKAELR